MKELNQASQQGHFYMQIEIKGGICLADGGQHYHVIYDSIVRSIFHVYLQYEKGSRFRILPQECPSGPAFISFIAKSRTMMISRSRQGVHYCDGSNIGSHFTHTHMFDFVSCLFLLLLSTPAPFARPYLTHLLLFILLSLLGHS